MSSRRAGTIRRSGFARSVRSAVETLENRVLLNGSMPGVPDVEAQFAALKHHSEALGWILPEAQGAPDPSVFDHYQGIVRYPGTGTPIFYVTQLDNDDNGSLFGTNEGGYLHVVRMGSRDTDGERLRSNLQRIGADTEDTSPTAADRWISAFHFDGASGVTIGVEPLPAYVHPGGMAVEDDVLLVAMDTPSPTGQGVPVSPGRIVLFDLAEAGGTPQAPVPIKGLELDHSIDNLAITKIGDGSMDDPFRYMILTNGGGGDDVRVYETNGADLRAPDLALGDPVQRWDPGSPADFDPGFDTGPFPQSNAWPSGSKAHQSSTFIRQFDGAAPATDAPLYMIAMRRDGATPLTGDDMGDLYRVDFKLSGGIKLTLVRSRHFITDYDQAGHHGNFAAGSGAYVSPTGELILYNVPHDDQDGFNPDIVRMAEIRHRDVNREGSPLREATANAGGPYFVDEGGSLELSGSAARPGNQAWVELYDDTNFSDRSIVIDFADRNRMELNDLHLLDDFDNASHDDGRASSVRWRAALGVNIELFGAANFTATKVILRGTGQTEECSDLEDNHVDPPRIDFVGKNSGDDLEFGDSASSLRFVGTPGGGTLVFDWDLDGDGVFAETGADALNGDEVGATPTFLAGAADDPASFAIAMRVSDAVGILAIVPTTVTVQNAPPTASVAGDTFGVPGLPRNFTLSATDPSAADTLAGFTFAIDFGDGDSTVVTPGDAHTLSHTYLAEGDYIVSVTATDKDGGVSAAGTQQIEIKAAGILPDPTDPTKTALYVGGTLGDDRIKIIQHGGSGAFEVTIDAASRGSFSPNGRVIAFGQAGNDSIDVPNGASLPLEFYGGEGNDSLNGAAGPDLLVGGPGDDALHSGQSRDILIGGGGRDQLNGGADGDILIGSATIHDENFGALHAIQAEWLRTDISVSIRTSHLLNGTGLNGPGAKLDAASIVDDLLVDGLSGASGTDLVRE